MGDGAAGAEEAAAVEAAEQALRAATKRLWSASLPGDAPAPASPDG